MRLLLITDTHGNLGSINELAACVRADAVLHAGDFGFYDDGSFERLSDRELRLNVVHANLSRSEKDRLLTLSRNDLIEQSRKHRLLGEFQSYLDGYESFQVPLYAVWGNHEDKDVVERLFRGDVTVDNLHMLHHRQGYRIGPAFVYGLGGNLLPGPKMMQRPIAGGGGKIWSTLSQYADLVKTVEKEGPLTGPRLFVSHVSPGKEPFVELIGIRMRTDYTISGHMGAPTCMVWNSFAVSSIDEARKRLRDGFDTVRNACLKIAEQELQWAEQAFAYIAQIPKDTISIGRGIKEPRWYREMIHVNLPDAHIGYTVIDIDETGIKLQSNVRNRRLKARPVLQKPQTVRDTTRPVQMEISVPDGESNDLKPHANITSASDSISKIRLFMSLFRGRYDVYARRWENKNKGTSGYAPVCLNQWQLGVCGKPKIPCSKCKNKSYAVLDENAIEDHLRGSTIVGIYPMLLDETCCFLAMDFDEADWQKDVSAVWDVCNEFGIPLAVERSRSGVGCHAWFFFENPISAVLVRKFGTVLLTFTMNRRHEIKFKSYDRLFPSQDTMPKGGLGNLIALPLQKTAREKSNSEFVDEQFQSYSDQWRFLSSIQKISESRLEHFISMLSHGKELGDLKIDEEEEEKPWETRRPNTTLAKNDFPDHLEIVKANMLFVPKAGISQRALNRLKRLASFKNPMFYRQQAMRLSTYGHDRVISCADETKQYLCLPRGCEPELIDELETLGIDIGMVDNTFGGNRIDVEFKGQLRDEQALALSHLLQHDIGILSGTTAFGKTIVAIKLIAEKKINTLILVDKINLLSQWRERLSEFLEINEIPLTAGPKEPPNNVSRRGRKKKKSVIGQIGGGKNALSGIIDIAIMQSLSRLGEVKECVKNYGLIIADECHHASAFNYEQILKTTHAKYVYGLTATPTRKDGRHPILFMHCGPIRYRDNPKKQAENRPFDHFIIPRFTSLRVSPGTDSKDFSIQELYSEIMDNDFRDQLIVEDVLKNYHQGRNCLVLTLRTAHVEQLAKRIEENIPDVIALTGGMGRKSTQKAFDRIADIPAEKNIVLVATGHFIGEGFDEPRLDTLFLAMPISWKGTLQQYAGRLHRLYKTKKEVRIYDYVDLQIKMLENMYQRRLNGYASMGYKAKGEEIMDAPLDIIFTKDNFLPVFNQDIVAAKKEILIVSPFARQRRTRQMTQHLETAIGKNIHVTIVTRPKEDFPKKDHAVLQKALNLLTDSGINIIFKSNIHQKFAIMDQKIVWYGSINLLSYGSAQESVMRIEGSNIANELIKSMEEDFTFIRSR